LNTFVVSRAVRAFGIKVVLSGLGGDELFGGYPSFRRAHYIAPLWKLPHRIRHAGAATARPFGGIHAERLGATLDGDSAAFAAYRASRTLFGQRQLAALTGTTGGFDASVVADGMDVSRLSVQQQVSIYEATGYMRNTLLRDSDVFSMAHALELRVPIVDLDVARTAVSAARAGFMRRGSLKPILVEAVKDLLSPEQIHRPKKGFTLPFETWMRNELFDEVQSVLSTASTEAVGLRRTAVNDVWAQFLHHRRGVNWSRPWALYTLLRWASQNGLTDAAGNIESATRRMTLSAAG
jgi:asparagine synthase (glutamine-hydrolysing)